MSDLYDEITLLITLAILAVSMASDYRKRKVPNIVTLPAIPVGIILAYAFGTDDIVPRLCWLVLFFFFGIFRIIGMGDLKLIMAVIAMRGILEASTTLLMGALLMIAFCLMTDSENMVLVFKDTFRFMTAGESLQKRSDKKYPFAVFLAAGYPIAWYACGYARW